MNRTTVTKLVPTQQVTNLSGGVSVRGLIPAISQFLGVPQLRVTRLIPNMGVIFGLLPISYLLMETGDYLLLETGDKLLLETGNG